MKSGTPSLPPLKSVKVLDQLRERIRHLHYSIRTEDVYVQWVRAFIRFHGLRHPATLDGAEVEAFLSWLVNARRVAASTHQQARRWQKTKCAGITIAVDVRFGVDARLTAID